MVPKPKVHEDEDDLDDLDDVLDQFTPAPPKPASKTTTTSTAPLPATTSTNGSQPSASGSRLPNPLDDFGDDFAAELAKGMESMMKEIGAGPFSETEDGANPEGISEAEMKEREEAFKAAWEAMLIEGMDGGMGFDKQPTGTAAAGNANGSNPSETPEDAFQKTIRQAMEKLKESDTSLKADSTAQSSDPLEALLAQFSSGMGDGGETDEELQGMLETMMGQLMSKDVLYEPLLELHEKFPTWMLENAATISADDKTRFEAQQQCITKIIAIYEEPAYNDADPAKSAEVVNLMNEMQSYGSPPQEIMGPLPPGFDFGPDGMPKLPDGCVIS